MKSMTGHGRGVATAKGARAVVECFSVNRKQGGEVAVAAGRDLAWVEPRIREEVLKRIARGKVQVSVVIERESGAVALLDHKRAEAFLREARALQKSLGLSGEIRFETVLGAPGVLRNGDETIRDLWPMIKTALTTALDALLVMREREGKHLQKELTRSAAQMGACVRKIRPLAAKVPVAHREALLKRLRAARVPVDTTDARLVTEIALFADRSDITEELTRLDSHLAQFNETLSADGPVGRTLEFLVQEMGREWNTTGSKASDSTISRLVVGAKSELDRLREQLANIE